MIDISVKDLVKSFDEDGNLLDGISFDVQSGERVGLLGKNGAGKTTLFKILTGEIDYNSGTIAFAQAKKRVACGNVGISLPFGLAGETGDRRPNKESWRRSWQNSKAAQLTAYFHPYHLANGRV